MRALVGSVCLVAFIVALPNGPQPWMERAMALVVFAFLLGVVIGNALPHASPPTDTGDRTP